MRGADFVVERIRGEDEKVPRPKQIKSSLVKVPIEKRALYNRGLRTWLTGSLKRRKSDPFKTI